MKSTRPCILTICSDPGGARALLPVIQELTEDQKVLVINYAYNQGYSILQSEAIDVSPVPSECNLEVIKQLLQDNQIQYLITATSSNDYNWEQSFILAARSLHIKSLSILDFWSNYTARFSTKEGILDCLPDHISTINENSKDEMALEGIPTEKIIIAGQPAFDSLEDSFNYFSPEMKQLILNDLGIQSDELIIMFVSQPLRMLMETSNQIKALGYDEMMVLNQVVSKLEQIAVTTQKTITLLVRPHPREDVSKFNKFKSKLINIIVHKDGNSRELAMCSDLIVGMNSIFLIEACYLQRVVLSFQPNLLSADLVLTNKLGASVGIFQEDQLFKTIKNLLFDKKLRRDISLKTKRLINGVKASNILTEFIYTETIKKGKEE